MLKGRDSGPSFIGAGLEKVHGSYTLGQEDLSMYFRVLARAQRLGSKVMVCSAVACLVLAVVGIGLAHVNNPSGVGVAGWIGGTVLFVMAGLAGGWMGADTIPYKWARKEASKQVPQTFIADAGGFEITGGGVSSRVDWNALKGIAEGSGYLILWTHEWAGIYLPHRGLESQEGVEQIKSWIRTRIPLEHQ